VIEARGLAKRYLIGSASVTTSLRESVTNLFRRADRGGRTGQADDRVLWALDDVSFDVRDGEIVGVVGRNGSGKSTLLKILSRITEPTRGSVLIRGRVGSLLEVGTGFHPDLTGRENVFVNGAILGMRHAEIRRSFDEIVAFAEVDRFIDTPVKHYSSGMQLRLAFSVAAHLRPNILLVDEVLAVGDVAFQRKCLGKMDEVSHNGRTILLVSHQMNQLRRLCGRCLWLDRGRIRSIGETADVLGQYEASLMPIAGDVGRPPAQGTTEFGSWGLEAEESAGHVLAVDGPVRVWFDLHVAAPVRNAHHGITLFDAESHVVWGTGTDNLDLDPGDYRIEYRFRSLPIRPAAYRWCATLFEGGTLVDRHYCVPELTVATTPTGHRIDQWAGVLNVEHSVALRRRARDVAGAAAAIS
jgi:lipopolysaccharide transport system ATP-binding protein